MKAPGPDSEEAISEVVTPDDEDGRDRKELPKLQGQITHQHFSSSASCCMYV